MEYVKLNNTDLTVSRFCMGGCPMGGYDWGETHEENFIDAIHTALDRGVNFFDTADTYGLGQSEKTLAKGLGNHRNDVVIQTKFGVRAGHGKTTIDNSPEYIRTALDNSLRRLNTDYIDIFVVHYWDQITPVAEIIDELERQQQAGKIRYFGISNIFWNIKDQWLPFRNRFATAQYEFSLACRTHEEEIKMASSQLGANPLTWGSLGQGILSGKYDENSTFGSNDRRRREVYINFHGDKLKQNLKIVEQLRIVAKHHNQTCASVAIRFILDYLENSVVMAGVKNADQMIANLDALDWNLDKTEIKMLDEISRGML